MIKLITNYVVSELFPEVHRALGPEAGEVVVLSNSACALRHQPVENSNKIGTYHILHWITKVLSSFARRKWFLLLRNIHLIIKRVSLSLKWSTWPIQSLSCNVRLSEPFFFKALALWANAFQKSKCPPVCLFVCLSVHFFGTF